MKKTKLFITAVVLCTLILFTQPVGASPYYINVYTDGLNNSPEMEAEMLGKLGLLNGTDKGFELERPMTRTEAAIMLVRFLGEEKTALSNSYAHPFSDVPPWADPYIGWLWQNGLIKGISYTEFGSEQTITIRQYAGFLALALSSANTKEDSWNCVATEDEAELCDSNGFFNRDAAIALSVRALTLDCERDVGRCVDLAQYLIDKGVFTAEQFGEASWNIITSVYRRSSGGDYNNSIVRDVTGVIVAWCDEAGLTLADGTQHTSRSYMHAERIKPDGTVQFYILDSKTLKVVASDSYKPENSVRRLAYIGTVHTKQGDVDYLAEESTTHDVGDILSWDGQELKIAIDRQELSQDGEPLYTGNIPIEGEDIACRIEDSRGWRRSFAVGHSLLIAGANELIYLNEDGVHRNPYTSDIQVLKFIYDAIVTQRITEEKTFIRCIDPKTGEVLDEYAVLPDMKGTEGQRTILRQNYNLLYGEAGMYELFDGRLYMVTDRPVISTALTDEGRVILTHALGERINTPVGNGGNSIMIINGNGNTKTLLGNDPPHGIDIINIEEVNSELRFYGYPTGGSGNWQFIYELTDSGIKVVNAMGNPMIGSGMTQDEQNVNIIDKEQARLGTLGYGCNK